MKPLQFLATLSVLLVTLLTARTGNAISQEEEALRKLGAVNGLALYCKSLKQVRIIKKAIIRGVPKIRDYGEDFEEETNAAYLDAVSRQLPCPDATQLESDVTNAVAHMTEVFAKD